MLQELFGDSALSYPAVRHWIHQPSEEREALEDRPHSGCPSTSALDRNIELVKRAANKNRKMSIRQIAQEVGVSCGTAQGILLNELGMRKVCARWVPGALAPEQMLEQGHQCQVLTFLHRERGESFLAS